MTESLKAAATALESSQALKSTVPLAMPNIFENFVRWIMKEDEESKVATPSEAKEPTDEDDDASSSSSSEPKEDDSHLFPTHAAFTVPVEIRPTPELGDDQYGVFAAADIPPHTEFWIWTHRVKEIPSSQMGPYIAQNFEADDLEGIRHFLRRGFVLPTPYDDFFYSNPTDAGTYMNHSSTPNCARPHGTTRLIKKGEELTMDYIGNGNPAWYVDLCHRYGILTPVEIAEEENNRGGLVQPALYNGQVRNTLLDSMVSLQGL